MASIAIIVGGAVLNAAAFIGGNYLARALGGGDKFALEEKVRHDKALEQLLKNDKIRRKMAHVALERNDAERPKNEGEEDGNSGDESVDECDSESDDDDEVVAFVNESDSETQVPGNTPGSIGTRAGRLSIPNSRYLDWLA
ncbi:hypothetical protein ACROYT_G042125 [Oculina patagonica]